MAEEEEGGGTEEEGTGSDEEEGARDLSEREMEGEAEGAVVVVVIGGASVSFVLTKIQHVSKFQKKGGRREEKGRRGRRGELTKSS